MPSTTTQDCRYQAGVERVVVRDPHCLPAPGVSARVVREVIRESAPVPVRLVECKTGPRGFRGETGVPEVEMIYARRIDYIDDDPSGDCIAYRGEAEPGAAETDPVWRIRRFVVGGADGDVGETWAEGSAQFLHRWVDRATLSYR